MNPYDCVLKIYESTYGYPTQGRTGAEYLALCLMRDAYTTGWDARSRSRM